MIDYSRRRLLSYGGITVVSAGFGGLIAAHQASAQTTAGATTDGASMTSTYAAPPAPPTAFIALSRVLTAQKDPDPLLAARLYAELAKMYPDLDSTTSKLSALLADAAQTPAVQTPAAQAPSASSPGPLKIADPHLAEVYQQLLKGWYLGVIGPAKAPRCIAFENIVSYRVVSNAFMPPSYCTGQVNFWINKPATLQHA